MRLFDVPVFNRSHSWQDAGGKGCKVYKFRESSISKRNVRCNQTCYFVLHRGKPRKATTPRMFSWRLAIPRSNDLWRLR